MENKTTDYWEDYENAEMEKYDQDWEEYWAFEAKEAEEYDRIQMEKYRKEAIEKRRQQVLYDFSGDDTSLNPALW